FYDWKIAPLKSARKEVTVTVNPKPDADFTFAVNGSNNGSVTFTNASNGINYTWVFGDGIGTSTDINPVYSFAETGTYTVELTVQGQDCTETISKQVTVVVDAIELFTFYADTDGDTYGDLNVSVTAATAPIGYVSNSTDCDDNDNTVYPGAPEICDGKDN